MGGVGGVGGVRAGSVSGPGRTSTSFFFRFAVETKRRSGGPCSTYKVVSFPFSGDDLLKGNLPTQIRPVFLVKSNRNLRKGRVRSQTHDGSFLGRPLSQVGDPVG